MPNPYLSSALDRTIEPHTSLEESWFGLKVDITPGMRERAITVELAGRPCRVLSREDLLLHVCVHFCFHLIMGAPSLVQLADMLTITQDGSIDWPLFVTRSKTHQASGYILAALTLAQKLVGAPIPVPVLADLGQFTPPVLRRRISQFDLGYVLRRTQQKPLTTMGQRIRRGISDRLEIARWAPDWRGRWHVWQTALQLDKTDTGRILLQRLKPREAE
jgi:hypothetical protein